MATVFGTPSISKEFNAKLNAAAKAGEQDAIDQENERAKVKVCGRCGILKRAEGGHRCGSCSEDI